MKTSLELAMERLKEEGGAPTVHLTSEQKAQLKEVDRVIDSKIAEKKIVFEQRLEEARRSGDQTHIEEEQQELVKELARLETEREERREKVRKGEV